MNGDVDKDALYGNYQRHEDRRNRLYLRTAAKALDMADDDMQIQANKSGVGALGLIGTALAAGVPTALLAAFLLMPKPVVTPPVPQPTVQQPVATPAPTLAPIDGVITQEQKQPDGTWKTIGTPLPAKLFPDGTAQSLDGRHWRLGVDGAWVEIR